LFSILVGVILSLAAPSIVRAVPIGYHWQTQGHFHPPELAVGWYPVFHWVTDQGPHSFDPGHGTFTPGLVAAGGGTIAAPASFGTNMYSSSLMDDQMNTVVHRTTDDLTLLHQAWTLDRVAPGDDGYVFHLNELSEATTDGFSSTLVAPVDIPLTLVSLTPDPTAGPDVFDGYFQGTIPAGALGTSMVEPLFSTGDPFVLYNEAAAPFELTLQIVVPEPDGRVLLFAGAIALAMRRASVRTASVKGGSR
jgi:hypothetical protein